MSRAVKLRTITTFSLNCEHVCVCVCVGGGGEGEYTCTCLIGWKTGGEYLRVGG